MDKVTLIIGNNKLPVRTGNTQGWIKSEKGITSEMLLIFNALKNINMFAFVLELLEDLYRCRDIGQDLPLYRYKIIFTGIFFRFLNRWRIHIAPSLNLLFGIKS